MAERHNLLLESQFQIWELLFNPLLTLFYLPLPLPTSSLCSASKWKPLLFLFPESPWMAPPSTQELKSNTLESSLLNLPLMAMTWPHIHSHTSEQATRHQWFHFSYYFSSGHYLSKLLQNVSVFQREESHKCCKSSCHFYACKISWFHRFVSVLRWVQHWGNRWDCRRGLNSPKRAHSFFRTLERTSKGSR